MTDTRQVLDPKLIARIKKLHNMAEGAKAVGSLAEADSFLEAVKKTLAAHNLDMSVLNIELHDLTDPLGKDYVTGAGTDAKKSRHRRAGKSVEWIVDLGMAVADAHYCHVNYSTRGTGLFFYGRKANRETAIRMFVYLRDMAEALAWTAQCAEARRRRAEYGHERGTGQYRINWLEGFVTEVQHRYRMMRDRVENDNGLALVLVSVRREAAAAAEEQIGATWKAIRLPDSEALAGEHAGQTLWEVGNVERATLGGGTIVEQDTSAVRDFIAFLRDTPWGTLEERKLYVIDAAKDMLKWMAQDDQVTSDDFNAHARAAGAKAARDVNLNPAVLTQDRAAQRRLGGGQ